MVLSIATRDTPVDYDGNSNPGELVRDSLQVKGYQTIEAETRLAHKRQPELILMDIQLPGISGIEALQRLRADPGTSAIPVIAVTASVMPQDRKRVMDAGFDGFQGKPISVRELLAKVREILDKPLSRVVAKRSRSAGHPPSTPRSTNLSLARGCVPGH